MDKSNYKNLKLYTHYLTPEILQQTINSDLLPIFIARSIQNSGLIGKWHGTSVHFRLLAPSPTLLRDWKKNGLSTEDFEIQFRNELKENNYEDILKRISFLCDLSNAKGAVLFGYGKDPAQCHRSIVSKLINESGLLNNPIIEL